MFKSRAVFNMFEYMCRTKYLNEMVITLVTCASPMDHDAVAMVDLRTLDAI